MREIASVPGDLPPEQVALRYATARSQFRHDNTIDPLDPGAGEPVRVSAFSGAGLNVVEAWVTFSTDGSIPNDASQRVSMERGPVGWIPFADYVIPWNATIPGHPLGTVVRYTLLARTTTGTELLANDGQGFWFRYGPTDGVTLFAYRVGARTTPPGWFRDAVVYQVFVDRFRRGRGRRWLSSDLQEKHGGDLQGIIESLPWFEELGITCLWLSPIGPAPSYHRYDSTDPSAIDPIVGTDEDFAELAVRAHDRGIRIILDFVPSHVSSEHPAFVDAQQNRESSHADWFVFYEWPHRYRSFLESVPRLVSINTNSAGARAHLIASAVSWVRRGVDGFRLDHVIGHAMDFWIEFQGALERAGDHIVTVAEATDTGDALRRYRGKLDSVLDFPLAAALRLTFGTQEWSLPTFEGFLSGYEAYMSDGPERVAFLDNHDMDRFLHVAGGRIGRLKMAALFLMTEPQTPVLYYGTETGMSHERPLSDRANGGDALARQNMLWKPRKANADLPSFFRRLIALRKEYRAAIAAPRTTLHLGEKTQTWVSCRGESGRRLVIAVNRDDEPRSVPVPSGCLRLLATWDQDVAAADNELCSKHPALTLPPQSGVILAAPTEGRRR